MNILVDTSVWSLVLRRDTPVRGREADRLHEALTHGEPLFTTGLVLQELLQGFSGPKAKAAILGRFQMLPLVMPDRDDHVEAAALRNTLRRRGVQIGTIDALLAQLALHHDLALLTADRDFDRVAALTSLRLVCRP